MTKKKKKKSNNEENAFETDIKTKTDLKKLLREVRDRMSDESAAPVYAISIMNHVMNVPDIYSMLDKDNKELCRDIWLRIENAGFSVERPPMLFGK